MLKHVPIDEFIPGWFHKDPPIPVWTGNIEGFPAWTDGHIMLIGKPPAACEVQGEKDLSMPLKSARRPTLERLKPVAIALIGSYTSVVFSIGCYAQVKYWNVVHHEIPDCEWFGDERSKTDPQAPLVIRSFGKTVGLLCCLRGEDWQPQVNELLGNTTTPERTRAPGGCETDESPDALLREESKPLRRGSTSK